MSHDERTEPVLRASDLHKTYKSGHREIQVLQGVSLELRKGESLSVRGESGSGKSTLLNLLAGIETPESGEVFWRGESLFTIPESRRPARRSSYLGFVFQAYYLIPELNTLENVALAARIAGQSPKASRDRASELLTELGLKDRFQSRPDQLSGGERQRAAIARALINHPEVLLADEPTGNLDEHTSERVMEQLLIAADKHNTALVLVTHHPGFASRTRSQYHLVEGRLVS